MKRFFIIFISAVLILAVASMAFAANTNVATTAVTGIIFNASKKVVVLATSGGATFAAVSKHFSGNRVFGTASDLSGFVYKQDGADGNSGKVGEDPSAVGGSTASDAFSTGWSSL